MSRHFQVLIGRSPSTAKARIAVRAEDGPVIGETRPTGPRPIVSVVTPKVIAIIADRPRAPGNERGECESKTRLGRYSGMKTTSESR